MKWTLTFEQNLTSRIWMDPAHKILVLFLSLASLALPVACWIWASLLRDSKSLYTQHFQSFFQRNFRAFSEELKCLWFGCPSNQVCGDTLFFFKSCNISVSLVCHAQNPPVLCSLAHGRAPQLCTEKEESGTSDLPLSPEEHDTSASLFYIIWLHIPNMPAERHINVKTFISRKPIQLTKMKIQTEPSISWATRYHKTITDKRNFTRFNPTWGQSELLHWAKTILRYTKNWAILLWGSCSV